LDCFVTEGVGQHFGSPNAPVIRAIPLQLAGVSVTRINRTVTPGELAEVSIPPSDSYFLMLYLEHTRHADIGPDGGHADVRSYAAGTICLIDLRQGASVALHANLSSLGFMLPVTLFKEVCCLSRARAFRHLKCARSHFDPVINSLGMSLAALFAYPQQAASAVLEPIAVAVCEHLMNGYREEGSASRTSVGPPNRPLAVWQEKAALDFMRDNMATDITIAAVADSVGFSANHFSKCFKNVMGVTPHQWLVQTRLERSKVLLANPALSLSEVSRECGFFDQSHFCRAFARHTGSNPTVWRQNRRH
jgi:AraC-like DNA-binding protein